MNNLTPQAAEKARGVTDAMKNEWYENPVVHADAVPLHRVRESVSVHSVNTVEERPPAGPYHTFTSGSVDQLVFVRGAFDPP